MLSTNLVDSLDRAAANGILDYDGAAFITDTQPRYMGSPSFPVNSPQMNGANLQQPQKDEMVYSDAQNKQSKNPLWKKLLFGAIVVGLGAFGLSKVPAVKKQFAKLKNIKFDTTKIKTTAKNVYTKVCDFFKDGWNKLFKKKSAPTP